MELGIRIYTDSPSAHLSAYPCIYLSMYPPRPQSLRRVI
jgi:hypothetical protein